MSGAQGDGDDDTAEEIKLTLLLPWELQEADVETLAKALASLSCFLLSIVAYSHTTESGVQLAFNLDLG